MIQKQNKMLTDRVEERAEDEWSAEIAIFQIRVSQQFEQRSV